MKHAAAVLSAILLPIAVFSNATAQDLRSGQVTIRVTNPAEINRPAEVVGLSWTTLTEQLPALSPDRVRVLDAGTGEELPSQTIDEDADGTTDDRRSVVP